MQKSIDKIWKSITFCQVNNILNTQNRPFIKLVYDLLINLLVLVYSKKNTSQSKA